MTNTFENAKDAAGDSLIDLWNSMDGMRISDAHAAFAEIVSQARELATDLHCDMAKHIESA